MPLTSLTGERISRRAWVPPWVWHEHAARYHFAARYVADKTVVDCACGEGWGSAVFLRAGAKRLVALDRSISAIAQTRARDGAAHVTAAVCCATALPLPDGSADTYIALETLEHLDDPAAFLIEVVRVLKPSGIFICSTPNRRVTNPGRSIAERPWNRFHLREYTPRELTELLSATFRHVELHGQNPCHSLKLRGLEYVGRCWPPVAVALHQLMKLPAFLFDRPEHHAVHPLNGGREHEYLVAVCRGPR